MGNDRNELSPMSDESTRSVGAVVIGRNEGDRLRRCLQSLVGTVGRIVYVDSGSTDESVAMARSLGVDVVELDLSVPFTAARARNAGFERLTELEPDVAFVHFFDGDCEVVEGWVSRALKTIVSDPTFAVVWGRRREQYPEKTLYNRLCDLEWKWSWPFGEVHLCGGDALMRVSAFRQVDGFNPGLIAGEEPELCFRLRQNGWKIFRIDAEMTLHDAAMTRFSQWWRRALRGGYADVERAWLYRRNKDQHWRHGSRSTWFWGLALPVVALATAWWTRGWSLLLFAGYPLSGLRIYRSARRKGVPSADAFLYAFFCILGKLPAVAGQTKFLFAGLAGRRSRLIEYK